MIFKVAERLTVNYGVRYSYPGTISDDRSSLYNFTPARGFFTGSLYNRNLSNFAPRVGPLVATVQGHQRYRRPRRLWLVLRSAHRWPICLRPTSATPVQTGIYSNPAGPSPVFATTTPNVTFAPNAAIFATALSATTSVGALSIDPNYRAAQYQTINANVEQQFSKSTLFTVAYVGNLGRRLVYINDINQIPTAVTNPSGATAALKHPRPLSGVYPTLLAVNQVTSGASSSYHSLQLSLRQSQWHGISATAYYTWSKLLDTASSTTTPENSQFLRGDYAPSTLDLRNNFTGFASYSLPKFTSHLERLTTGYQVNAIYTFAGGTPVNILVGTNVSGTGENKDRPNVVSGVARYASRPETDSSSSRTYQYFTKSAWTSPCPSTGPSICYAYGNEHRDSVYGPGFGDIDLSFFKHTRISEHVNSELRAEIFNIGNQANFANPSGSLASSSFGVLTQTRNGSSAPGIGYGEPRNIQFAFKVSF